MGYSGWGLGWFKRKRAREGDPDTAGPRSGANQGSAGGSPRAAGAEPATRHYKRPAEKKVTFQAEGRTTRATQQQPALPEGKSSKLQGQKRSDKQRSREAVSDAPGRNKTAESPRGWRSSTRHRGEQQQQEENVESKQDKPAASKKTRLASNAKSQQPRTRARQNAVEGQAASQRPSEQTGQQQQRRPRTSAVLPSEQQQQDQKPQKAEAKPSGRGRTPARGTAADDGLPGPSNRLAEPVVEPPAAGGNEPAKPTGMKRVRSSWKMRPLFTDEKLRVFVEGRDDELALYDDGEFYRWLTDCEAGKANPEDGFCYPLVVQDQDMRTVLEIKPLAAAKPAAGQAEAEGKGTAAKPRREDAIGHLAAEGPIRVPLIRVLPQEQQPDMMLEAELVAAEQAQAAGKAQDSPSPEDAGGPRSSRPGSGPVPSLRRAGATAAVDGAGAQSDEDEGAGDADPPYVRYLEPTPDDLDLQVEYDLDEEDEEWLEAFNERARKGKSRKARLRLNEDWMERLMDRMEKEYTHALQRHPEKWVVQQQPDGSSSDMPSITLPRIEEVFSLQDCLQAPGMHHYPSILEAVYNYWKGKHARAGSPLIQRLWYEPPWHRKKAAERVAEEEAGEGGPFLALDPLEQLQGVRRRKLDTEEIRSRFSELRRDLDAARLLADQVRRREKLKKQELRIFQQEWAARLAEIEAGKPVTLRNGELRYPPPTLSTLGRLRAAGGEDTLAGGPPGEQEGPAEAAVEDRAARLAARREARLAVVAAGDKKKRPSEAAQAGRKGQSPAPPRKEKLQKGKQQERASSPHASINTATEAAEDAADATTSPPDRRARKARQQQQSLQKQTMGPSTAYKNQQRLRQQLQQEEQEAMPKASHLRQRNRGNAKDAVVVEVGLGKPAAAGQSRGEQAGEGSNHGKPSRAAAVAVGRRLNVDERAGTGKHAAAARNQGRQAGDEVRHSKPSRAAAVEQLPKPAPATFSKKRRREQAHPASSQETVVGVDDPASEVDSDVTHKENQAPARPPKRTRAAAPSPPRKPSHHAQQQKTQQGSRRAPAATRRPAAASPLSREVLALLKQTIPDFAQGLRR